MDIEELIVSKIKDMLENGDDGMVVKKTIPMKPEWFKKHEELHKLREFIRNENNRADTLQSHFWSTIELELKDYSSMRVNHETKEIEILEMPKGKNPVKSFIQIGKKGLE